MRLRFENISFVLCIRLVVIILRSHGQARPESRPNRLQLNDENFMYN